MHSQVAVIDVVQRGWGVVLWEVHVVQEQVVVERMWEVVEWG